MTFKNHGPGGCCCEECGLGPLFTGATGWNVVSGKWTYSGALATTSANAKIIASRGNADWNEYGSGNAVNLAAGNAALFGWSDPSGDNQVYVEFTVASGTHTVNIGSFYDEDYSRFYFWFVSVAGPSITYTVYSVTSGGAPVQIAGPTTLTAGAGGVTLGDSYSALHAQMRRPLFGSGTNTGTVSFTGTLYYCYCLGASAEVPQKYNVAVSGVTVADPVCTYSGTPYYFDVNLLNRGGVARNYYQLSPASPPFDAPCVNCCHSYWEYVPPSGPPTKSISTWFSGVHSGSQTILSGYAYADELMYYCGLARMQMKFTKTLPGLVDLRTLSGETLSFDSAIYSHTSGSTNWVTGGSFTVTAVP